MIDPTICHWKNKHTQSKGGWQRQQSVTAHAKHRKQTIYSFIKLCTTKLHSEKNQNLLFELVDKRRIKRKIASMYRARRERPFSGE